jgi:ketosteroid isomerase-like protein
MKCGRTILRAILVASALEAMMTPVHAEQSAQISELTALSDAWIDAEVRRDTDALERLLDERFLATFASGKTVDRAEFIDWVRNSDIKPFEVTNETVRIHGDTAVVIGVDSNRTVKFTWVAVKRDQRWRVVSETFSRVPAPNR